MCCMPGITDPVERAALLVGERLKALLRRRQVENRVHAPQPPVLARRLAGLAHRGGVHQADQPAARHGKQRARGVSQQPCLVTV